MIERMMQQQQLRHHYRRLNRSSVSTAIYRNVGEYYYYIYYCHKHLRVPVLQHLQQQRLYIVNKHYSYLARQYTSFSKRQTLSKTEFSTKSSSSSSSIQQHHHHHHQQQPLPFSSSFVKIPLFNNNNNNINNNNNDIEANEIVYNSNSSTDPTKFVNQVNNTIQNVLNDVKKLIYQNDNTNNTTTTTNENSSSNDQQQQTQQQTQQTEQKHKQQLLFWYDTINIKLLPKNIREHFIIARYIQTRIQTAYNCNQCTRCWMIQKYCFCHKLLQQQQQQPVIVDDINRIQQKSSASTVSTLTLQNMNINRIFILMHHKEFLLSVDTTKLILSTFPNECRLVIGGISQHYQSSLHEMISLLDCTNSNPTTSSSNTNDTTSNASCSSSSSSSSKSEDVFAESLPTVPTAGTTTTNITNLVLVLFPSKNAQTFQHIVHDLTTTSGLSTSTSAFVQNQSPQTQNQNQQQSDDRIQTTKLVPPNVSIDVILIDGTWEQARKLYNTYILPYSSSSNNEMNNDTKPNDNNNDNNDTNRYVLRHVCLSDESLQSLVVSQMSQVDNNNKNNDKEIFLKDSRRKNELSSAAAAIDSYGKQLRYHPNPVREISTIYALQLLLNDIDPTNTMLQQTLAYNQKIAHDAKLQQYPLLSVSSSDSNSKSNNSQKLSSFKWIQPKD